MFAPLGGAVWLRRPRKVALAAGDAPDAGGLEPVGANSARSIPSPPRSCGPAGRRQGAAVPGDATLGRTIDPPNRGAYHV